MLIKSKTPSMKVMYAFYPMVIITGFIQLLVPSTIHMIMKNFSIQEGEAGMIPFIYFTGMLVSAFLITQLIKKLSVKQLMAMGALIVLVGLLVTSQINSYHIFAILFLLIGFGNGLMIILPGIYTTHHYARRNAEIQSLTFSFLAIGFVVGPVFPGIVEYFELSWKWCFAFPALLIIPALIPILLAKHEPIDNAEKLTLRIIKEIISFDRRFFIWIIFAVVLAAGSTTGFLTWLITFLENKRGTPVGMAHGVLAIIGIATVIGRMVWGKVSPKITVYRTLLFIVPIAALFVFVAPFPRSVTLNIILFIVATVFISGINPLFLSAAGAYPKSHSSSAFTLLFIAMAMGGIIIPFGIGLVFEHAGPVIGMSSISLMFLLVWIAILINKKEMPLSEHFHRNPLP
ncbi:MAG: MFS transporter [Bacteroidetes bacterium]|nr:MFS transporter [Bacteroidota bacterium]